MDEKFWTVPDTEEVWKRLVIAFKGIVLKLGRSIPLDRYKFVYGESDETALHLSSDLSVDQYVKELKLRGYSPKTQRAYAGQWKRALAYFGKPPEQVDELNIKAYLLHLVENKSLSSTYINQAVSAISFYLQDCSSTTVRFRSPPAKKG